MAKDCKVTRQQFNPDDPKVEIGRGDFKPVLRKISPEWREALLMLIGMFAFAVVAIAGALLIGLLLWLTVAT